MSDAADVSLRGAKIGGIAIGPGELFRPGRNQLAMAIQQAAVTIEEKIGVPHGSHADGTFFGDADREDYAMTLGNVAQFPRVGTGTSTAFSNSRRNKGCWSIGA